MKKTDQLNTIKKLAQQLLNHLLVEATVNVSRDSEGAVHLDIVTEESGLVIGHHGETINSIQLVLSMMAYYALGEWTRIVVDVGGYRQKREETVRSLALRAATEVAMTKQPMSLPYLVPFERRIVHMTLADHSEVVSESQGEGRERRIIVKPK